jgi:alpha-glutamyl/putrescinyl thymine pyrophosphorylase clade 1
VLSKPAYPHGARVPSDKAPTKAPAPLIISHRQAPTPSIVFDTYWRFATERQDIFFKRVEGRQEPWTSDPVLQEHKFTNAYRASDRISQYLIKEVVYRRTFGPRDAILRILLFKIFNKIETWELLQESLGEIVEGRFSVERLDQVLTKALEGGASIYSAAYIMPSGPIAIRRARKHRMHLELLAHLFSSDFPERLMEARTMAALYELLRSVPSIGPFLAYQFATDLNYSDRFDLSEMEFVVPGPGARDGIRKCFSSLGGYTEADVIRWVADQQEHEFSKRGLQFRSLWGRPLQLIDCQNLFCEVDKYARRVHPDVAGRTGRTRIKQRFVSRGRMATPWFPPKWNINERVSGGSADDRPHLCYNSSCASRHLE